MYRSGAITDDPGFAMNLLKSLSGILLTFCLGLLPLVIAKTLDGINMAETVSTFHKAGKTIKPLLLFNNYDVKTASPIRSYGRLNFVFKKS